MVGTNVIMSNDVKVGSNIIKGINIMLGTHVIKRYQYNAEKQSDFGEPIRNRTNLIISNTRKLTILRRNSIDRFRLGFDYLSENDAFWTEATKQKYLTKRHPKR